MSSGHLRRRHQLRRSLRHHDLHRRDGQDLNGQSCVGLGLANGPLSCKPDCKLDTSLCPTCGNQVIDNPSEECDGCSFQTDCVSLGFDKGALACNASCKVDSSGCSFNPLTGSISIEGGAATTNSNQRSVTIHAEHGSGVAAYYLRLDDTAPTAGDPGWTTGGSLHIFHKAAQRGLTAGSAGPVA